MPVARFYLIFSAAGLFGVALSYGVAPAFVLPKVFDLTVEGTDQIHIFRAIMGLYLGMISLWIVGAFRPDFTRVAVIAEIFFMLGLACGRVLSIIVDGVPSTLLVAYAIVEVTFGLWGIWILNILSTLRLDDGQTTDSR